MSIIFWVLVLLAFVFAGSFIYRLSASVREYKREVDREHRLAARYGFASQDTRDAEFDMFLLRWACVFSVLAVLWGLVEGAIHLFS